MVSKKFQTRWIIIATMFALTVLSLTGCSKDNKAADVQKAIEITNVSYDPTRELYAAYNKVFEPYYEKTFG